MNEFESNGKKFLRSIAPIGLIVSVFIVAWQILKIGFQLLMIIMKFLSDLFDNESSKS